MGASSVSASFCRDVRDGAERQQWDDLSSIMNSVVLSSSKDRWTCDLSGDGEFKVKVIRNFIDDLRQSSCRRGCDLYGSPSVSLCNAAMRMFNACVSFRCDVARVVLRKICRWWDLDWQEICSFLDWDAWFLSFRLSSRLKSILEALELITSHQPMRNHRIAKVALSVCEVGLRWESDGLVLGCRVEVTEMINSDVLVLAGKMVFV
ncbi:hypothetical protein Tco_0763384 [Tanacetum coccineum]